MIKLELERNEALRKPANEGQGENIMTTRTNKYNSQTGTWTIVALPKGVEIEPHGYGTYAEYKRLAAKLFDRWPHVRIVWRPVSEQIAA